MNTGVSNRFSMMKMKFVERVVHPDYSLKICFMCGGRQIFKK